MSRPSLFLLAITVLTVLGHRVEGQRAGRINSRLAAQVGLEPAWSTAVPVDFGGKITGVKLHISATGSYQTTVITDKFGRKSYFSERALSRSGSTVGLDQSLRMAELREAILKRRSLDPVVETVEIPEVTLYLRTSMGTVMAINGETGRPIWTQQAGKNGYPNYTVAATDDTVATISGTKLYVLNAANGDILQTRSLINAAGAGPVFARGFMYIPTTKGLLEVYDKEDIRQPAFTLSSPGRIRHQPNVGPRSISWTTDRGDVYVAAPGEPGIIYEFKALGPIADAPAQHDTSLYMTSLDGFVYAVNDKDGSVNWRYSSGEPIRQSPMPIEDVVFVITGQGKLVCLEAATGEERWASVGVQHILSVGESLIYCATASNTLVAYERSTGVRSGETMLNSLVVPYTNTQTDRIYLAGMDGTFQCFREIGRRLPLTRFVPPEQEEAAEGTEPTSETPLAAEPEPAQPPAGIAAEPPVDDDNPFAIGLDAGNDEPAAADADADLDFSFDDLGDDEATDSGDADGENPFAPF